MTHPEFSREQLATPEQASELFEEVKSTAKRGNKYATGLLYQAPVEEIPPEVAEHLPEPSENSHVQESVEVERSFDLEIGQPLLEGVVGSVTFVRKEQIAPDLLYAARAIYHITASDAGATYGLERHIANLEYGPHRVRVSRERRARRNADPHTAVLEIAGMLDRLAAARIMEKKMGIPDVSQAEAEQIIDYVQRLNSVQ